MGKRKLSLQQQRRIASQQQRVNKATAEENAGDDENFGAAREGLVITRYSRQADVLPIDPATGTACHEPPSRCHIRANVTDLVTGDRVSWRPGQPTGIIEAVLPRTTLMSRPDNRGQLRPIAANVDQIAVVFAPQPEPHQNLIDRYLVAAERLEIKPLLIFNKLDLLGDDAEAINGLFNLYLQLGYPLVKLSTSSGAGIDALHSAFAKRTTVLVGQSGVGKSSIINLICPQAQAATGELSQIAKGKHTTTAAKFYYLPLGGSLIDSPGIREFGLWHLDADQIARGFIEFLPFLGLCKFRDCRHFDEPDCAILAAVAAGQVDSRRLLSYQQIVLDLERSE